MTSSLDGAPTSPVTSTAAAAARAPSAALLVHSPADHGGRLDGTTNDRVALQAAIDTAYAAGGGTVVIPGGRTLLTGSFELKSHVTLHLEPGSRIVASHDQADYRGRNLIEAFSAEDIAITGTGTIDGQGTAFMAEELPHIYRAAAWRPGLMLLEGCRRVQITGVTLRDSAVWCVHLAGCDGVVIHGITILNNLKVPNCDGIDPDHSRNVRISDCHIEAGDDAIVIKTSRAYAKYHGSENITVTNCTLQSTSAALKIGTETVADVRNVIFSNCVIRRSHRGVAIVLRDEGSIENVLVQNLVIETQLYHPDWWGAAEPIYVSAQPRLTNGKIGRIRGLRFDHILARSEGGVFIAGSAASQVEDVSLHDVSVELVRPSDQPTGRVDVRPPDALGHSVAPLTGFRIQHARDFSLQECTLRWSRNRPDDAVALRHDESTADIRVAGFRELR